LAMSSGGLFPPGGAAASSAPGDDEGGRGGGGTASDAPPGSDFSEAAPGGDAGVAAEVDLSAAGALSQTIYVNNLTEKVPALELKRSLYGAFKRFGKIIDICSRKTYFLRGQAWVVFETVEAAKNAVIQMQGFPLFEKKMRIAFADATSDVVAKQQGTYQKRPKRKRKVPPPSLKEDETEAKGDAGEDAPPAEKIAATAAPAAAVAVTATPAGLGAAVMPQGAPAASQAHPVPGLTAPGFGMPPQPQQPLQQQQQQPQQPQQPQRPAPPLPPPVYVPPNKQLLATQLPNECTKEMLEELFKKCVRCKFARQLELFPWQACLHGLLCFVHLCTNVLF
jgi:hypothetical protein